MGRSEEAALCALENNLAASALARHVPRLSMLRALGLHRDELAHSRVLAALFDTRSHRHANETTRLLLRHLADLPGTPASVVSRLRTASETVDVVYVRRELRSIDLVLDIRSGADRLVIGIENKVDAGEQPAQLRRYQAELEAMFPSSAALLVFLTPSGRLGSTATCESPLACLAMGYGALVDILGRLLEQDVAVRDRGPLEELRHHLSEEIMGDEETARVARAIWKQHGRAAELLAQHRPTLGDMRCAYEDRLRENLAKIPIASGLEFSTYPDKDIAEIKVHLQEWDRAGFPFTLMLYAKPRERSPQTGERDGRPAVRLFISGEAFEKRRTALTRWAHRANERKPLFDEQFRVVRGWSYWRRVLREDEYPHDSFIDDWSFDGDVALRAAREASRLAALVHEHIDRR